MKHTEVSKLELEAETKELKRDSKEGKVVEAFSLVFCQMCERMNRGGGKTE